jgi:hypothetical protein
MNTKYFKLFVETGVVDQVVIYRSSPSAPWQIIIEGERISSRHQGVLETAKGEVRFISDLSTAYGVIRAAGWSDAITIQG